MNTHPQSTGSLPAPHFPLRMKKRTASATQAGKSGSTTGSGSAALNLIVKGAYRRHSRGRIARAAMASCLGI